MEAIGIHDRRHGRRQATVRRRLLIDFSRFKLPIEVILTNSKMKLLPTHKRTRKTANLRRDNRVLQDDGGWRGLVSELCRGITPNLGLPAIYLGSTACNLHCCQGTVHIIFHEDRHASRSSGAIRGSRSQDYSRLAAKQPEWGIKAAGQHARCTQVAQRYLNDKACIGSFRRHLPQLLRLSCECCN